MLNHIPPIRAQEQRQRIEAEKLRIEEIPRVKVAEAKNPQNSGALLTQSQDMQAKNKSDSCILQHPIHMGNQM